MVGGELGDDVGGLIGADGSVVDSKGHGESS
jgi:hypothetical protein